MQMASWKNYDKEDLCLVGFAGGFRWCNRHRLGLKPGDQRIRPDSRSTKISTSATAL